MTMKNQLLHEIMSKEIGSPRSVKILRIFFFEWQYIYKILKQKEEEKKRNKINRQNAKR